MTGPIPCIMVVLIFFLPTSLVFNRSVTQAAQHNEVSVQDLMNVAMLNALAWETADVVVRSKKFFDGVAVNEDLIARGHADLVKNGGMIATETTTQRMMFDFSGGKILIVESSQLEILDFAAVNNESDGRKLHAVVNARLVDTQEKKAWVTRLPGKVFVRNWKPDQSPDFPDIRSIGITSPDIGSLESTRDSIRQLESNPEVKVDINTKQEIRIRIPGMEDKDGNWRMVQYNVYDPKTNMPRQFFVKFEPRLGAERMEATCTFEWEDINEVFVPKKFDQSFRMNFRRPALGVDFLADVSDETEFEWIGLNNPVDPEYFDPDFLKDPEKLRRLLLPPESASAPNAISGHAL